MASLAKRLSSNVEGNYFVDSTCINCDTCRQLAPTVFDEKNGYSFVVDQPNNAKEEVHTKQAIIACPTGSIGSRQEFDRKEIREEFPLQLEKEVFYCGFNSPKSFGGNSYFIHGDTNWIIDSPRYTPYLVKKFQEMGGIDYIFLTHRDDVADAAKYAENFPKCKRIIHDGDSDAHRDAEIIIEGTDSVELEPDFTIIPTPGHTRGHMVLLYSNKFLFTGDHLYWRRDWNALRASRNYCWYDWDEQQVSMQKLTDYEFNWVLPGHGQRMRLPKDRMKEKLEILIDKMRDTNYW